MSVFEGLSFECCIGGITAILGKSGSGKTTFLRMLSELESIDGGVLEIPGNKRIGFVFQEPRLLPWLSAYDNIAVVLGKKPSTADRENVWKWLELVGLKDFARAKPAQLSGGMQQRVAIARAFFYEPDIILMDEPFAALDYFTREAMQRELLKIQALTQKDIVFVTHNIDESLLLGKKIIIFERGGVKKEYSLEDYPYPRDLLDQKMITVKQDILTQLK
ncbi:MAG: ABC transporter ATP-binding protein [Fusobacteriaceae bacterium]|nr:ABC transporter ATP-binding protein [Fusobacteriaceae bacterium]